jgi:type IV pilus assembly protein PilC
MPSFVYVAKGARGQEISGFLNGPNLDHVIASLHGQGLVVINVREDRSGRAELSWSQRLAAVTLGHTNTRDLALFTRQLSTLIDAGIPLVRGLRGLAADETNRGLSRAAADVADRMERGSSLADAMSAHPRSFGRMYVSLVRAGERSGTLDSILEQLAVYMERIDATKTKVRSAMAYPVFVLIFAFLVTLFLLFKIVPTFEGIYGEMGQDLPAMTQVVIDISRLIRDNLMLAAGSTLLIVFLFLLWSKTPAGRYFVDDFLIRMPIFGPIVRKAVLSRFARTFGILLRSGLPVLEAMELVKGATGNAVVCRAIDQAKASVESGATITPSFRATKKMPEMVLQLMGTGEETGDMDAMLIKVSDFYDRQVEASVHGLASLVEPLLIVLVGVLVGIIVVTMFLPIFYLGDAIMKGGANL